MQTIAVALIVFQLLAKEDDELRFFIALLVSSSFGVFVYCTVCTYKQIFVYLTSCKMGGI